jgi:hypothetical protein
MTAPTIAPDPGPDGPAFAMASVPAAATAVAAEQAGR